MDVPIPGAGAKGNTYEDLVALVLQSNATVQEKCTLLNELRKSRPAHDDRWVHRWVVWILGTVALSTVAMFAFNKTLGTVPDSLIAISSASVGALAGFLAPGGKKG